MRISTKGRYALRLMLDLALNNTGEPISLKDIARRQEISDKYLEQIISVLNKAKYVKSIRGAQGGYILTKRPVAGLPIIPRRKIYYKGKELEEMDLDMYQYTENKITPAILEKPLI